MGVCRDEMPSQEYGSHIGPIGGPIAAIPFGGGMDSGSVCLLTPHAAQIKTQLVANAIGQHTRNSMQAYIKFIHQLVKSFA